MEVTFDMSKPRQMTGVFSLKLNLEILVPFLQLVDHALGRDIRVSVELAPVGVAGHSHEGTFVDHVLVFHHADERVPEDGGG